MKNNEFRYSAWKEGEDCQEEWEYRASDNGPGVVSGIIVRYGDVAKLGPHVTEQIEEGAFNFDTPWWANRMHDRREILGTTGDNLTLLPAKDAIRFRLQLSPTPAGIRADYEAAHGWLRGVSIELGQVKDSFSGLRRIIQKSSAIRFALVDSPAYPGSLLKLNRWEDWEDYRAEKRVSVFPGFITTT